MRLLSPTRIEQREGRRRSSRRNATNLPAGRLLEHEPPGVTGASGGRHPPAIRVHDTHARGVEVTRSRDLHLRTVESSISTWRAGKLRLQVWSFPGHAPGPRACLHRSRCEFIKCVVSRGLHVRQIAARPRSGRCYRRRSRRSNDGYGRWRCRRWHAVEAEYRAWRSAYSCGGEQRPPYQAEPPMQARAREVQRRRDRRETVVIVRWSQRLECDRSVVRRRVEVDRRGRGVPGGMIERLGERRDGLGTREFSRWREHEREDEQG